MLTPVTHQVNCYRRASVNHANCRAEVSVGAHDRCPAIDAQLSNVVITVANRTALTVGDGKTNRQSETPIDSLRDGAA
jgi:hypothetical protein